MTRVVTRPLGRPPSTGRGDERGARVSVRLSADEHATLLQAAQRSGEGIAAWLRRVGVEAARRREP